MNKKAEKFDQFLEAGNITNWFVKEEHQDDANSVVYRCHFDVAAQQLPLFVVLDDTVFNLMRLIVTTGAVPEDKREAVVEYLNELNGQFKIFKYYLGAQDHVVYMDISVPSAEDSFNPELLVRLLAEVLEPHLEEFYPNILKKVLGTEVDPTEKVN